MIVFLLRNEENVLYVVIYCFIKKQKPVPNFELFIGLKVLKVDNGMNNNDMKKIVDYTELINVDYGGEE